MPVDPATLTVTVGSVADALGVLVSQGVIPAIKFLRERLDVPLTTAKAIVDLLRAPLPKEAGGPGAPLSSAPLPYARHDEYEAMRARAENAEADVRDLTAKIDGFRLAATEAAGRERQERNRANRIERALVAALDLTETA